MDFLFLLLDTRSTYSAQCNVDLNAVEVLDELETAELLVLQYPLLSNSYLLGSDICHCISFASACNLCPALEVRANRHTKSQKSDLVPKVWALP